MNTSIRSNLALDLCEMGETPWRQPLVIALTFRMVDLGNRVDRVEGAHRITLEDALAGANCPGCDPLPQQTPANIRDAVAAVLLSTGIPPPDLLPIEGYTRIVSDRAVDVVAWMVMLA